jgi:predicted NBD/HSP70 family sugar kinase
MTTFKSDQIAALDAVPPVVPKANERHGRLRLHYWSFATAGGGGPAVNDTVVIGRLPQGARILGGRAVAEAMSSGGGTAQVSIGLAADAARYLEASSVDAATGLSFADTLARNFGDELATDTDVVATALGEAWAASKKFNGYILYAVD